MKHDFSVAASVKRPEKVLKVMSRSAVAEITDIPVLLLHLGSAQ